MLLMVVLVTMVTLVTLVTLPTLTIPTYTYLHGVRAFYFTNDYVGFPVMPLDVDGT